MTDLSHPRLLRLTAVRRAVRALDRQTAERLSSAERAWFESWRDATVR